MIDGGGRRRRVFFAGIFYERREASSEVLGKEIGSVRRDVRRGIGFL